jgi:hypothetical protein
LPVDGVDSLAADAKLGRTPAPVPERRNHERTKLEAIMRQFFPRTVIAAALSVLPLAAMAAPAMAASAGGDCGNGLAWATIDDLRAQRPGIPLPLLLFTDKNGNGAVCYRALPDRVSSHSPEYGHLIFADDRVPAGP